MLRRALAVILLCLAAPSAWANAPAIEAREVPSEWVGIEFSPVGLNFSRKLPPTESNVTYDSDVAKPGRLALGLAATVRGFRFGIGRIYVTPLQLGLGVAANDDGFGLHAHLSAELGVRLPARIELGLGAGIGTVYVFTGNVCDGACSFGGEGVALTPVARVRLGDWKYASNALFARALIPSGRHLHSRGDAWLMLFGIEGAFKRAS